MPGGVGQRPEQVERGPDPDLAPGRAGVAHRRMEVRGEQEGEAELAKGLARRRRVVVDPDAERVEHVRRSRPRRHRPIAVLGDRHARRGRDERGGGRDVERAAAVAAGPDDVDRALGCLDPDDALAHGRREPGQLVGGLAAHPEAHQQRRELGRRRLAVHHRAHRAVRLGHRQRAAVDDRVERGADQVAHGTTRSAIPDVANDPVRSSSRDASPSPAWRRKFARRCGPCGVSTDFGVELDALERQRDVADAHDHPVDLAHRGDAQLRRQRRRVDRQRVVARGHERRRHPLEEPGAVVGHLRRLAVDERRGADDRRPERRRHRLHPETDARATAGPARRRPSRPRPRSRHRPGRQGPAR